MAKTVIILAILLCSNISGICSDTNTFIRGFNMTPFYLIHRDDYGGGIAFSTTKTNSVGVGFAVACINESGKLNFYSGSLSLRMGRTINLISTNYPINVYFETGVAANMRSFNTIFEQSIIGASVTKVFNNNNRISVGAGVGHNSRWMNDNFFIFTTTFSFR
jgi:hypothetical protein